jgi:hypothetical protein
MEIIKYSDIEILNDEGRYYIVHSWNIETYNNKTFEVPSISKEISEQELQSIEKQYFREKKLVRILKDDITLLIKK